MPPKKKTPKTYKGKPTALGGGGRFQMLEDEGVPPGVLANKGRKKYGKQRFQEMAAAGKKRAAKKKAS